MTETAKAQHFTPSGGVTIGTSETTITWVTQPNTHEELALETLDIGARRLREATLELSVATEALTSLIVYGKVHERSTTWIPLLTTYSLAEPTTPYLRHAAVYTAAGAYVDSNLAAIAAGNTGVLTLALGTYDQIKITATSASGTAVVTAFLRAYEHGQHMELRQAADETTGYLIAIGVDHHKQHEGEFYFVKTYIENTGAADTYNTFEITTPDSDVRVHFRAEFKPDTDAIVQIQRAATLTGGSAITPVNADGNSAKTATTVVKSGPTISVAGAEIWLGRSGGSPGRVGGATVSPSTGHEIILKADTTYVVKITKKSASSDLICDIHFMWYEQE
jgi:hypothetical protein